MGALSLDLRERIVAVLRNDPQATYPQVAARFSVCAATVERLWGKFCAGESLSPKPNVGRTGMGKVTAGQYEAFEQLASSRTDWTLQSLADAWQEQTGVKLSQATVSRLLAHLRFSHKKSAGWLPSETKPSGSVSRKK